MDKFTQVYAKYVDAVSRKLNRRIVKEQVEGYWKLDLPFDIQSFLYDNAMTAEQLAETLKSLNATFKMDLSEDGSKSNIGSGYTLTAYVPKGQLSSFLAFNLTDDSTVAEIWGVDAYMDESSSEEKLASDINEYYGIGVTEVQTAHATDDIGAKVLAFAGELQ